MEKGDVRLSPASAYPVTVALVGIGVTGFFYLLASCISFLISSRAFSDLFSSIRASSERRTVKNSSRVISFFISILPFVRGCPLPYNYIISYVSMYVKDFLENISYSIKFALQELHLAAWCPLYSDCCTRAFPPQRGQANSTTFPFWAASIAAVRNFIMFEMELSWLFIIILLYLTWLKQATAFPMIRIDTQSFSV